MLNNYKFLAIIPARGGSKRLPRKNILNLCGKPLIAWTIEAGKKSKYIDKVVVSSDDDEILDIANEHKVTVLKRPDHLAKDTSKTFDVIKHVIDNAESYDYIVLLQPTSPLRNKNHVDAAIDFLFEKNADAVISVSETNHSPMWSNTLDESLSMKNFLKAEVLNKRSQELEKYYRLNGSIYICKTNKLLREKSFFLKDNIFAFKMDKECSVDVDEEADMKIAEIFMTNK